MIFGHLLIFHTPLAAAAISLMSHTSEAAAA